MERYPTSGSCTGGHRGKTPRNRFPKSCFAHIGEPHKEGVCQRSHRARWAYRVQRGNRSPRYPGQAKGRHFVAGFDVLENLRGGLGVDAERADLIVLAEPESFSGLRPKRIDHSGSGGRAVGDQDLTGHCDSARRVISGRNRAGIPAQCLVPAGCESVFNGWPARQDSNLQPTA
ncbi:MAG: hypothetical protein CM15mP103_12150 [Gammaproteobacteria bacterium]|nr:MAG: hypothetical protein CM15mP103_12150 [Gammaproteobacteria bacterium]